jgi:hypothetical protein
MHVSTFPPCTQLPNGVKVAVSDSSQKCQKLTKVALTCSLQLQALLLSRGLFGLGKTVLKKKL